MYLVKNVVRNGPKGSQLFICFADVLSDEFTKKNLSIIVGAKTWVNAHDCSKAFNFLPLLVLFLYVDYLAAFALVYYFFPHKRKQRQTIKTF